MSIIGQNTVISVETKVGDNTTIGHNVIIYGNTTIGDNVQIQDNVVIGKSIAKSKAMHRDLKTQTTQVTIGANSIIGTGSIIYHNVSIGQDCLIGDQVNIREGCSIGNQVLLGRKVNLNDHVTINSNVKVMDNGYVVTGCIIGQNTFIGMGLITTNDNFEKEITHHPPQIGEHVKIGSGVIILPGVNIASCSIIAAGAVVTKDTQPNKTYLGIPAKVK